MSAQLTVAEQLIRSADVIDHNGHTKDNFFNPDWDGTPASAPVCTVGAVLVAVTGNPMGFAEEVLPVLLPILRAVSEALPSQPPAGPDGELDNLVEHIAWWNDRPERTAAEVSAFLRSVAVAA